MIQFSWLRCLYIKNLTFSILSVIGNGHWEIDDRYLVRHWQRPLGDKRSSKDTFSKFFNEKYGENEVFFDCFNTIKKPKKQSKTAGKPVKPAKNGRERVFRHQMFV